MLYRRCNEADSTAGHYTCYTMSTRRKPVFHLMVGISDVLTRYSRHGYDRWAREDIVLQDSAIEGKGAKHSRTQLSAECSASWDNN